METQNQQFKGRTDYLSGLIQEVPDQISRVFANTRNVISIDILTSNNLFTGVNLFTDGISANSVSAKTGLQRIDDGDLIFFMDYGQLYYTTYGQFKGVIQHMVGPIPTDETMTVFHVRNGDVYRYDIVGTLDEQAMTNVGITKSSLSSVEIGTNVTKIGH